MLLGGLLEALFRNAVLTLAADHGFARKLINSGRLSLPAVLSGSPLQTPCDAPLPPGSASFSDASISILM